MLILPEIHSNRSKQHGKIVWKIYWWAFCNSAWCSMVHRLWNSGFEFECLRSLINLRKSSFDEYLLQCHNSLSKSEIITWLSGSNVFILNIRICDYPWISWVWQGHLLDWYHLVFHDHYQRSLAFVFQWTFPICYLTFCLWQSWSSF